MTVNEVSKLSGLTVRTLHYYDQIGLLSPASISASGYRVYNSENLEKLAQIMLLKELEFSLGDIKEILNSSDYKIEKAIDDQIKLLKLKKSRLEKLITFAEQIKSNGGNIMNFDAFENKKSENYKKLAKQKWGKTEAYKEYELKSENYSNDDEKALADGLMSIFAEIEKIKDKSPADKEVLSKIEKLKNYISENFYNCTNEILCSLGEMYNSGGEMTDNIDKAGGKGCAEFTAKAINEYCK